MTTSRKSRLGGTVREDRLEVLHAGGPGTAPPRSLDPSTVPSPSSTARERRGLFRARAAHHQLQRQSVPTSAHRSRWARRGRARWPEPPPPLQHRGWSRAMGRPAGAPGAGGAVSRRAARAVSRRTNCGRASGVAGSPAGPSRARAVFSLRQGTRATSSASSRRRGRAPAPHPPPPGLGPGQRPPLPALPTGAGVFSPAGASCRGCRPIRVITQSRGRPAARVIQPSALPADAVHERAER